MKQDHPIKGGFCYSRKLCSISAPKAASIGARKIAYIQVKNLTRELSILNNDSKITTNSTTIAIHSVDQNIFIVRI